MLDHAAALHVTTDQERDVIADIAPTVPRFVVPVGINMDEYDKQPHAPEFRRKHLNGHAGPMILFLGRVTFKKGLDVLLRGVASLKRDHDDAMLAIVGPDDENLTPSLQAEATRLGISARVRFVGGLYGDEKLAALSSATIWVLPSHTENFGVSVLEAAAVGLPILVSPHVNIGNALVAAGAAVLTEVDPEALAKAMSEMLTDNAYRAELGLSARAVASSYDWSAVSPRLAQEYRAIVEQLGPERPR